MRDDAIARRRPQASVWRLLRGRRRLLLRVARLYVRVRVHAHARTRARARAGSLWRELNEHRRIALKFVIATVPPLLRPSPPPPLPRPPSTVVVRSFEAQTASARVHTCERSLLCARNRTPPALSPPRRCRAAAAAFCAPSLSDDETGKSPDCCRLDRRLTKHNDEAR